MLSFVTLPNRLFIGDTTDIALRLVNESSTAYISISLALRLPPQILLLRGTQRIRIDRIDPSSHYDHLMQLKTQVTGEFEIICTNYSYRTTLGTIERHSDIGIKVRVDFKPSSALQASHIPFSSSGSTQKSTSREVASLHRQLENLKINLLKIEEKKTTFIDLRTVPIDLEEQQKQLEAKIREIERRLISLL